MKRISSLVSVLAALCSTTLFASITPSIHFSTHKVWGDKHLKLTFTENQTNPALTKAFLNKEPLDNLAPAMRVNVKVNKVDIENTDDIFSLNATAQETLVAFNPSQNVDGYNIKHHACIYNIEDRSTQCTSTIDSIFVDPNATDTGYTGRAMNLNYYNIKPGHYITTFATTYSSVTSDHEYTTFDNSEIITIPVSESKQNVKIN